MNESEPNQETQKIEKQTVVDAYKQFIDMGITSPDDLDLDDPAVIEANNLFDIWKKQNDKLGTAGDLETTLFYVDAGFTNRQYVEDVLLDFAGQLIGDEEESGDLELVQKMQERVDELKARLLPDVE